MTKKELEELVAQQQEIIDGLYEEISRLKARNAAPATAVQRQMTMDSMKVCNSPWPNFTGMARATR